MIWLNVRLGEQTPTTICLEETIFIYSDISMQMDKILCMLLLTGLYLRVGTDSNCSNWVELNRVERLNPWTLSTRCLGLNWSRNSRKMWFITISIVAPPCRCIMYSKMDSIVSHWSGRLSWMDPEPLLAHQCNRFYLKQSWSHTKYSNESQ